MKLVILGPPGAGKGTQAEILSERFNVPTISTGAIIRAAIREQTPLGVQAKANIDRGELVPDEVVIGIVTARLAAPDCADGFILDGFPRTEAQATYLDGHGLTIDAALSLEVAEQEIVARLAGRRECAVCASSYHLEHKPPKTPDVCDRCGGKLIPRPDDKADIIRNRLAVYQRETAPLKRYYAAQGKLLEIAGRQVVAETTAAALKALGSIL